MEYDNKYFVDRIYAYDINPREIGDLFKILNLGEKKNDGY